MSRGAGVAELIARVDQDVTVWRGFPLVGASEAWPQAGAYRPVREGESELSDTTAHLLRHWFRAPPHEMPGPRGLTRFRYWPHQRRFVESAIYLHEVRGIRSVDQLYDAFDVVRDFEAFDPWAKLGGQLATGAGKTKVMSQLIAWATLNAVREGAEHLDLGPQVVVIAPGLFVRERLTFDFNPDDGRPSVFRADPVIPRALERDWRLSVYGPNTTPMRLDPREPALIVTNIHQLMRAEDLPPVGHTTGRQEDLFFKLPDPRKLEDVSTPLLSRFRPGPGLLVINDEAHHVGDEPAHQRFEQAAENKRKAGVEVRVDMAWIRSLRALHARARLGLQVDLSATLYEEEGGARQAKGNRTAPRLFRHTIVDYPLREAITDGVTKRPILETVKVAGPDGEELPAVRENQPNAWLTHEPLLRAGIGRWRHVRDQLLREGDPRKPILFLIAANQNEAQEVANFLTYGKASREKDLGDVLDVCGFVDPDSGERLFVEAGGDGRYSSTVLQIHVGEKEQSNEEEWAKVRARINMVDHDAIPNPRRGEPGQPDTLPNPYNVVISVMMLKEGWDVRNVKVIVPLRTCDSRTLTEQTLGRGLRRMHPPEIDESGAVTAVREDLYVMQHPSFARIIEEISDLVEVRTSDEIDHPPEYVRVTPREPAEARDAVDVRIVTYEGMRDPSHDRTRALTLGEIPPTEKLPWEEDFHDRSVETALVVAMGEQADGGQRFEIPAAPSFRDYDEVMELAYVLPLLKEVQASFVHKNAVKALVKEHLERRTYKLPMGIPLSFDRAIEAGPESGRIAICNLLRPEVIARVKDTLRNPVRDAIAGRGSASQADLRERLASGLDAYPARKQHELERTERSVFANGAFDSADELRFAALADRCPDVLGWLYNHREGVGFRVAYDWQGHLCWYYPDFLVRVSWAGRVHNLIVEVKGRMDERDEAKARVGRRYADRLAQHDHESWHYLLVHEDPKVGRAHLSWAEQLTQPRMSALLRHTESITTDDEGAALGWRLLTREGIARHLERAASQPDGLTYDALVAMSDARIADPDRLLLAAEGMVTDRQPRLRRAFFRLATGEPLPEAAVNALFARVAAGDESGLEDVEVLYLPFGGPK